MRVEEEGFHWIDECRSALIGVWPWIDRVTSNKGERGLSGSRKGSIEDFDSGPASDLPDGRYTISMGAWLKASSGKGDDSGEGRLEENDSVSYLCEQRKQLAWSEQVRKRKGNEHRGEALGR